MAGHGYPVWRPRRPERHIPSWGQVRCQVPFDLPAATQEIVFLDQLADGVEGFVEFSPLQIDHGRILPMRQDLIGIVAGRLCYHSQVCEVFLDRSDIQLAGTRLRKLVVLVLGYLLVLGFRRGIRVDNGIKPRSADHVGELAQLSETPSHTRGAAVVVALAADADTLGGNVLAGKMVLDDIVKFDTRCVICPHLGRRQPHLTGVKKYTDLAVSLIEPITPAVPPIG
jgi:hypothetical protein